MLAHAAEAQENKRIHNEKMEEARRQEDEDHRMALAHQAELGQARADVDEKRQHNEELKRKLLAFGTRTPSPQPKRQATVISVDDDKETHLYCKAHGLCQTPPCAPFIGVIVIMIVMFSVIIICFMMIICIVTIIDVISIIVIIRIMIIIVVISIVSSIVIYVLICCSSVAVVVVVLLLFSCVFVFCLLLFSF